jgi:uncharacterized membrane protein YsdA (DUF1294 family)
MTKFSGRIIQWSEEDGRGVIETYHESATIPFNYSGIADGTFKPDTGEKVLFTLKPVSGGRLQAFDIRPKGLSVGAYRFSRVPSSLWFAVGFTLVLTVALALCGVYLPFVLYVVMSLVCWLTIHRDKQRHRYRNRVHGIELAIAEFLGGWAGSRLTQQAMNHINLDPAYQKATRLTVSLHILALAAVLVYAATPKVNDLLMLF